MNLPSRARDKGVSDKKWAMQSELEKNHLRECASLGFEEVSREA